MSEPAQVAWNRARTMAEKLVEALDALDDAGGLRRASSSWRPAIRDKARVTLKEARTALQAAEEQLRPRKTPKPQPSPGAAGGDACDELSGSDL